MVNCQVVVCTLFLCIFLNLVYISVCCVFNSTVGYLVNNDYYNYEMPGTASRYGTEGNGERGKWMARQEEREQGRTHYL